MEWKFKKNSLNKDEISLIENKLSIKLPTDFIDVITENNGARPSLFLYDLNDEKEKVFDALIDFSPNSENNVLEIYDRLKNYTDEKIIPFGEDGFGNYICFQYKNSENPNIVFFNHENNQIKHIANSFSDFIKLLY